MRLTRRAHHLRRGGSLIAWHHHYCICASQNIASISTGSSQSAAYMLPSSCITVQVSSSIGNVHSQKLLTTLLPGRIVNVLQLVFNVNLLRQLESAECFLSYRNSAVWAIGKHWRPEISQNTLSELAEEHASNSHGPAARSVEQANGHRASASGATDESASSKMHAEMPLLKAHGTRPTSAAGSSAVLQESKKQESFKSGSLINSQSNAQAKIVRATEAPAMSPSKAVTPGAGNKDQ